MAITCPAPTRKRFGSKGNVGLATMPISASR